MKNLEVFFRNLRGKLSKLERGSDEYMKQVRRNSEEIRDKLLRNIMIRRTRSEILEFYADDLHKQGLSFPKLGTPNQVIYAFDEQVDEVFTFTTQTIRTLKYVRYTPLLFLVKPTPEQKQQMVAQTNISGFMKSVLVKRLESSFFAFKNTLRRFIESYTQFIKMCNDGEVYISKKVNVYDLLDNGDDEKLLELIDTEKVQHFTLSDFNKDFIPALEKDLTILKRLGDAWDKIDVDPKLDEFKQELSRNLILKNNKLIIFTESKETAKYLGEQLSLVYGEKVVTYSGDSSDVLKRDIEYSYNPKFANKGEEKYNILITTDVLAEGVNLHRSGVLINYDLPWNPTRIMQRVGRINRIGTEFDQIYVFNFFPTAQSSEHLPLEECITEKLQVFHDTLGEDFKYLTDNEQVTSHKLYTDLNADLNEEVGSNPELFYLAELRRIRDDETSLFDKIKKLPRKAKSGMKSALVAENSTITFLRRGYLKMFFKSNGKTTDGLTFIEAIKLMRATLEERRITIGAEFFDHLAQNKEMFDDKLIDEDVSRFETVVIKGNDAKAIKFLKALSKCKKFTDTQEEILKKMLELWQNGEIPANITKEVLKYTKKIQDELELFSLIQDIIPDRYFKGRNEKKINPVAEKEVILSCWLKNGGD